MLTNSDPAFVPQNPPGLVSREPLPTVRTESPYLEDRRRTCPDCGGAMDKFGCGCRMDAERFAAERRV